jgi:hypothetical protein
MGLLSGIFDNPAIKKAAFGQLKSLIVSEGLAMIIVRIDPADGELIIDMYKPGEAVITVEHPDGSEPVKPEAILLTENTAENAKSEDSQ